MNQENQKPKNTYLEKCHNKHKFTAFQSSFLKGRYKYLYKVLPEKINEYLSNKKSSEHVDIKAIQNLALELIKGNENIVFLDPLQEKNIFLNESRLAHKTFIMNRPQNELYIFIIFYNITNIMCFEKRLFEDIQ